MNKVLLSISFYLYVFLVPMEEILNVLFGITTFAKPYRLAGVLFILFTWVDRASDSVYYKENMSTDKYLYRIYLLGILITAVQAMFGNVHFSSFWVELVQIYIILMVYHNSKQKMLINHFDTALLVFYVSILINAIFISVGKITATIAYMRFSGFMENPNMCGFLLNVGFIINFYYFKRARTIKARFILVPLFFLLAHAIINTGSRSNLLLLVINLAILPFFIFRVQYAVLTIIITGISIFFTPLKKYADMSSDENLVLVRIRNQQRFQQTEDIRFRVFKAGRDLGREILFTGVGIGQFIFYFPEYFFKYDVDNWFYEEEQGLTLHNYYLTLLIEYSFLGLILFLMYLYHSWKKLLNAHVLKKKLPGVHQLKILLLLFTMVICAFHTGTNSPVIWLLYSFATGTRVSFKQQQVARPQDEMEEPNAIPQLA